MMDEKKNSVLFCLFRQVTVMKYEVLDSMTFPVEVRMFMNMEGSNVTICLTNDNSLLQFKWNGTFMR